MQLGAKRSVKRDAPADERNTRPWAKRSAKRDAHSNVNIDAHSNEHINVRGARPWAQLSGKKSERIIESMLAVVEQGRQRRRKQRGVESNESRPDADITPWAWKRKRDISDTSGPWDKKRNTHPRRMKDDRRTTESKEGSWGARATQTRARNGDSRGSRV